MNVSIITYSVVSFILFFFCGKVSYKINLVDLPNKRKIHSKPIAYTGGIIPFSLLSVLFLINAFNYFDGLDGVLGFTSITVITILYFLVPDEDVKLFLIMI